MDQLSDGSAAIGKRAALGLVLFPDITGGAFGDFVDVARGAELVDDRMLTLEEDFSGGVRLHAGAPLTTAAEMREKRAMAERTQRIATKESVGHRRDVENRCLTGSQSTKWQLPWWKRRTWFITIEEHGGHERHKDDKGVDHWPFSACQPETTQ